MPSENIEIRIVDLPSGEVHIMVDWFDGRKGILTRAQAVRLAAMILLHCGNLPADVVAGLRARES